MKMQVKWDYPEIMAQTRAGFTMNQNFLSWLKPVLQLSEGSRVLDVGCGVGTLPWMLYKIYGNSIQIIGVDTCKSLIEYGRVHWGRPVNVNLQLGDAADLGFSPRSFDTIVSFGLLEWLQNPHEAIREMVRVVKGDGRIIILILEMSRFEKRPIPEIMEVYFQDYLKGLSVFGVPIKEEALRVQSLLEQNGLHLSKTEYVFEIKAKITKQVLRAWKSSSNQSIIFSEKTKDFYFQFMQSAGWTRERFNRVIQEELSSKNILEFYEQHVGEDFIQRLPLVLLSCDVH